MRTTPSVVSLILQSRGQGSPLSRTQRPCTGWVCWQRCTATSCSSPAPLAPLSNPQIRQFITPAPVAFPRGSKQHRSLTETCQRDSFAPPRSGYAEHTSWLELRESRGDRPRGERILPTALTCHSWGGSAMGVESILHYPQHREGSRGSRGAGRKMEELKGCSRVCTTFTKCA